MLFLDVAAVIRIFSGKNKIILVDPTALWIIL